MASHVNLENSKLFGCEIMSGFRLHRGAHLASEIVLIDQNFSPVLDIDSEGGAVDVDIKDAADMAGYLFYVRNTGSAGAVTIVGDSADVVVIEPGDTVQIYSNGEAWDLLAVAPVAP